MYVLLVDNTLMPDTMWETQTHFYTVE